MATKAKKKVGDIIEDATQVERPDGSTHSVVGGLYVLDVPGTHLINGEPVEVS